MTDTNAGKSPAIVIAIRPLREKDIPALVDIADDTEIQKMTIFVDAQQRGEGPDSLFRRMIDADKKGWFCTRAVVADDKIVGCVTSFSQESDPYTYHIGGFIAAGHRGRGIATEALKLLMTEKEAESRVDDMQGSFAAAVGIGNYASLRMVEKLGFAEGLGRTTAPMSAMTVKHFVLEKA